MRLRVCLAKIIGRSYGAKYIGSCLMLQTGRPFGAKEKVVILHGNPNLQGIVYPKGLS